MIPLRAIAFACSLALAAAAQQTPPPELAPLVPPKAPWLRKNQKQKSAAKKKPALPLPPIAPLELPKPPRTTNEIGVLVQNDGLDPAAAAELAERLRAIASISPRNRAVMLSPPAQPCADAACDAALPGAEKLDQVLVASVRNGAVEMRLVDVAAKKATTAAAPPTLPGDARAILASAEALGCKLLVPEGCRAPVAIDVGPGIEVELDAKPLTGTTEVAVGMHTLVARAGGKAAMRALPVTREGAPSLYARVVEGAPRLLDAAPPPAAPVAALAATPPATSRPSRRWTRPVGYAALGLAAVAAAGGVYFGAKSRSQINDAEAAYRSNGGAYRADQASLLSDGNSKAHSANALFAAAGVLAAAGAVFTFAF